VTDATPATTDTPPPPPPPSGSEPRARRTPWRAAFFVLAGAGIVAGVIWALFGSRLLVVRSVTVTGTHLVTSGQVIAAADVPPGTSLVGLNAGQVAQRVEGIRQVASATVAKDWPDHLAITVRERVPVVAVRMAAGGYDLVDPTGVLVVWSRAKPARLPLYLTTLNGSALRGNPGLSTAAAVLAELSPALSKQVDEVSASPAQAGSDGTRGGVYQVLLGLHGGKTVLWGGTDGAARKNRELAALLTGSVHYVDVSAPGTVVTK
jgi:cell division protein FtsQ